MAEYISREEAIKGLREVYEYEYPTASGNFDEYASHDVPNVLRNIPAADVQPVKRGKWIYSETPEFGNPYGSYICSECNHRVAYKENYCPNCGARMVKDGEQND